jgi:hypothetical protein
MSPSAHGSHRGNSNVTVLRFYSTHSLGKKIPDNAVGDRRVGKHDKWTVNTLTGWLHEVTSAMRERPREGLSWTSHSIRKGAATFAYNVGETLQ